MLQFCKACGKDMGILEHIDLMNGHCPDCGHNYSCSGCGACQLCPRCGYNRHDGECHSKDATAYRVRSHVEVELTKITAEMLDLLKRKNHDYGDDNLRKFGRFGILVRVNDKLERLRNMLQTGKTAVVESERDTWMDIAGYAIQAVRFIDEESRK